MTAEKIFPKNLMEELVDSKLDELMEAQGICCCKRCRVDVFTLALNHLPPKYVDSVSGDIFSRVGGLEAQFQADIITEILFAIEVVKNSARHDEKEEELLLKL